MNKFQVTIMQTTPRKYYDEAKKANVDYEEENSIVGEFVDFEDAIMFIENILSWFKDVTVKIKAIKMEV